jgi:hypothetical protein
MGHTPAVAQLYAKLARADDRHNTAEGRRIDHESRSTSDPDEAYLGSLLGSSILAFRSPVAGLQPAHWHFRPFD